MTNQPAQSNFGRFAGKGVFPHQYAFTLLFPVRNIFLSPRQLVKRLELKPDAVVLEVGCGPGYFSPKVAAAIPNGKLVLADIQPEMLKKARARMEKKNQTNTDYYTCQGARFDFPDNTFDRIFLITVMGEVEEKELYLKEFFRMLKPTGLLSVSEQAGDPDKLSIAQTTQLATQAGFAVNKLYGGERNYTLNFIK